ncbi:CpsB/CapC family capsule biosynthesis tyrosine phosphatase [Flavobacterium branchiophilum]|uniref:protein-tyrosine-phosphatase n=1 Tax=Flavobacterium branchiophilum (strain FL-15) TaxID=1034807 RepID=G2Z188_FLABF|nr:CpsB/CapC family capsule biosynthesis tyrosine phosphatase [Flavobacterium branchiophilum]CCB69651.1 Probable capsular polysaccharide biosynthesis protein [Flavobacterium branchiophilum FL-15]
MFSIFKKSSYLMDYIPDNFTDIHSHLLPGIDDGAKNLEDTNVLVEKLEQLRFKNFIATPHILKNVWDNDDEIINSKLTLVQENFVQSHKKIAFKAAAEYMMDNHFYDLLKNGNKILPLKDNHILVEMSYLAPPIQLYDILFEIQIAGYQPILAHPERYNSYHNNLKEYDKLIKAGCKFQLNMLSTVGYYGPMISKTADYLLKNDLITYIGSDTHHEKHITFLQNKIILKNHEKLNQVFKNNAFFDFQ